MNIIDYIVIAAIVLYALNGLYRGFIPSLLNLGGFFLSWILSFLTYPLLSRSLAETEFFGSMRFYIEGSEKLGESFELTKLPVSQISPAQLETIMTEHAKMPTPFDTAITKNVSEQAFADQGLTTLGEYFDQTIFNVMVNIFSMLILFFCLRVLFTLLTNAFSWSFSTPQLKRFDYLLGGGVGLLRGFFSMYMVFTLVAIALIMLPIPQVSELVNNSTMCKAFYNSSIVLPFISGVV